MPMSSTRCQGSRTAASTPIRSPRPCTAAASATTTTSSTVRAPSTRQAIPAPSSRSRRSRKCRSRPAGSPRNSARRAAESSRSSRSRVADHFQGMVYGYLVDDAVQGDNVTDELIAAGRGPQRRHRPGSTTGAPTSAGRSREKKLWFFVDYNRATTAGADAAFPLSPVEDWKRLFFAKGTWQVVERQSPADVLQRPAPMDAAVESRRRLPARSPRVAQAVPAAEAAERAVDVRPWSKTVFEAQGGKMKVVEDNTFPLGSFDPSEVNGYEDIGSGVRYGTWDRARGRFDGRDHWDLEGQPEPLRQVLGWIARAQDGASTVRRAGRSAGT